MKALILAAGEGTRMKPLTTNLPKPLLPVAGKPCIEHIIDALKECGITEMVFIVGFQRKAIQHYLEEVEGIEAVFIEQRERKGTAHAINMARTQLSEPFLCINGDVIMSPDTLSSLTEAHEESGGPVMALSSVEDPTAYGVVEVDPDSREVRGIEEKPADPKSNLINTGLYLFTPEIFDAISRTGQSSRGEFEITDSIMLLEGGRTVGVEMTEPYIDISHPWDLLKANSFLMRDLESDTSGGEVEDNVVVHGNLVIGEGTVVRSGTYVEGNVLIGRDCKIGPGAYLRGSTCIGDGCHIGSSVEIKNTLVMRGSNVPHHNYVGDSVIGRDCNLGAGTKVANLRLDGGNVTSYVKRKAVDSGLRKLGVILGDGVKTGINASLNVGTVVGSRAFIGPGTLVDGWIEQGSHVL